MPARTPRRHFAAPWVVTLAMAPACATRPAPDTGAAATGDPSLATPTAGATQGAEASTAGGGEAPTAGGGDRAPATEQTWTLTRAGGKCTTALQVGCDDDPSGATPCVQPAAVAYACPRWDDGVEIDLEHGGTIEGIPSGKDCTLYVSEGPCPPGASCNPPPPRRVACPGG